jgi:hypothetical protein
MSTVSKVIRLNEEEVLLARKLAGIASGQEKRRRGFYGTADGRGWNSPVQHLVGKLGELATKKHLSVPQLRVYPYFENVVRSGPSDISVEFHDASIHIEVKSWRTKDWPRLGRCIRPEQFRKILSHRNIVMWCCVGSEGIDISSAPSVPVTLMGFSKSHDLVNMQLRETVPGALNYQLNASLMRGMDELPETFISFALFKQKTMSSL